MARLEGKRIRAIDGDTHAPEVKFEIAFQTAGIPMSIATVHEGRLLEVNDAFCEASGYARHELIGRSAAELGIVSPRDREAIVGAMPDRGIARDLEITFRRRDGSVRRGFISASSIEVEGEPCFLNATIDLTDRWAAEQALRESEERFRTIFDSAGDGIVIVDQTGRYLDANPAACKVFGYTREEFVALSLDALASPEETALNRDRLALVLERGFLRFDSTFLDRDGTAIPTAITATPMDFEGRKVALVMGRDLTEFKLAESRREEAERQSARISRLAATASALDATIAAADEQGLLRGIARLLVSIGGLATATVALKEPAGRLRIHAFEVDEMRLRGDIETPEGLLQFATEAETHALQTGHAVAVGTGAVLPIGAGGFALGIIAVTASEPGFFGEPEVQLLEQIAGLVAARLGDIQHHARELALTATLEAERREAERFAAMAVTIDRALNRMSRPGDLYREACRLPVDLGVCVLARFGLVEERIGGRRLRFVASIARDPALEGSVDALLGHTAPFSLSSDPPSPESGPVVVNDVLSDGRFRRRHRALEEAGLRAAAEMPVLRGPSLAGRMVFCADKVGAFGANEVALLNRLAADVGHRLTTIESERRRHHDKREIDRLLNRDTSNAAGELGPQH